MTVNASAGGRRGGASGGAGPSSCATVSIREGRGCSGRRGGISHSRKDCQTSKRRPSVADGSLALDLMQHSESVRLFFVSMRACWSPKLILAEEIWFARVAAVRPAVYVSPSAHAMCRAPCLRGCLLRCRRRCVLRRADAVGGVLSDGLEAVGSLRSPFTLGPTEAPNLTVLELYALV